MEKSSKLALTALIAGLSMAGSVYAGAMNVNQTNPWNISLGTSYTFLNGTYTRGDLSTTDESAATHEYVRNSNLDFSREWTNNVMIARDFGQFVTAGLYYEHLKTNTSPGSTIVASGGDAGTHASYNADLAIDTFLAKAHVQWHHAFSFASFETSPFVGIGLGTSHLALSNQAASIENGAYTDQLKNKSTWRFAYMAELGLITDFSSSWSVNYGVRYTNYGRMNSGTSVANYPSNQKEAVKSNIHAFAPFVNLTYHF